jgi:signal transduction histidine kinase
LINYKQLKNTLFLILVVLFLNSCTNERSSFSSESIYSNEYNNFSNKKKAEYLDSLKTEIEFVKKDSLKIKLFFEVAAEYYYLNDFKNSYITSKKIYTLSQKNKDSISIGRALYYMGDCFENFQKDSAYYYYKESEKVFRLLKDDERIAKALFNKAHLLFTTGNYIESEVEVIKALQKIKKTKKYELLYSCYYLQSCNHTELEEFDEALRYMNLAFINLEKIKNINPNYLEYKSLVVVGICNIYDKKEEFDKSIALLKTLLTDDLKLNHSILYSNVLSNLGYSYMKSGNFTIAKQCFDESIDLLPKNSLDKNYLFRTIHLGEYYLLNKDTLKSMDYFRKALTLSKLIKSNNELLKTLNFLSLSDKRKSNFYKNEYVKVSDSIIKQQRLNRDKFARIEYETSKVEDENEILSTNNLLLILGLAISTVVFLTVIIVRSQVARKKELLLIKQKELANDELLSLIKEFQYGLIHAKEEEQSRISKELHDGVVNQIYAIRMVLDTLNDADDAITRDKRITYIKELHKVETEIRNLSHELYIDYSIYDSNYLFLLHSLVKSNTDLNGTVFNLSLSDIIDWNNYSSIVKINLYRILQELFLNVNKYAQASVCNLVIDETTDFLLVTVEDDGIGFDKNHTTDGIGLKNINERIKTIDAQISIETAVGKGVRVSIKIKRDL